MTTALKSADVGSRNPRSIDFNRCLRRLTASEAMLRQRILARAEAEGSHEWALWHVAAALGAMAGPLFGSSLEQASEEATRLYLASSAVVDDGAVHSMAVPLAAWR